MDLKAYKAEAHTRKPHAVRRYRRRAYLVDLVGSQKTRSRSRREEDQGVRALFYGFLHPSMLMSMRSIAATEAGCSISNVMLQ